MYHGIAEDLLRTKLKRLQTEDQGSNTSQKSFDETVAHSTPRKFKTNKW